MGQLRPSLITYLCFLVLAVDGGTACPRHYVLVHGAGQGAWCWYKVQNLLQRAGHNVTSLDLTSAGINPVDANTLRNIEDYDRPLIDLLSALPENEKVVLVGHSAGGLSLTHAIHTFGPKKISTAVFVAAIMLRSGFMTAEDLKIGLPDLSNITRFVYEKGPNNSTILTSFIILPEIIQQVFFNRSPKENVVLASTLFKPVPAQPILLARFNRTSIDIDRVARVYVKTTMDRGLSQEMQNAMIKKWPPGKVAVLLNSDHCPFFSAPRGLVNILLKDILLASALVKPAPAHAMQTARFKSTGVDVDGVPRVYVKTMMDRVFKQEQQDAMIKKWPPHKVVALNSDHCFFFSAPKQFTEILLKL